MFILGGNIEAILKGVNAIELSNSALVGTALVCRLSVNHKGHIKRRNERLLLHVLFIHVPT